jgi:hypothetical protein
MHDPDFADAAAEASEAGVRFRAAQVDPTPEGYRFLGMIPVDLRPHDIASLRTFREALAPYSGWKRRGRVDVAS